MLNGYRRDGLSEEEVKLRALRETERRQKYEAEARWHNFKKLEEPMARPRQQQQHPQSPHGGPPPPVNAGEHAEDPVIAFGSVSAMKANFNHDSFSSRQSHGGPPTETEDPVQDDLITRQQPPTPTDPVDADPSETTTTTGGGPPPAVEPVHHDADTTTTTTGAVVSASQANDAATTVVEPTTATTTTTIHFRFGIISTHADDPYLVDPYLRALREDVLPPSSTVMTVHAVRVEPDDAFTATSSSEVKRVLVTVAVELSSSSSQEDGGVDERKRNVYETVGRAIQSGRLLESSRKHKPQSSEEYK